MARDTGSTYVKNVCWTISGQGMATYNSGSFDFPSFTSATSYTNVEIGWNDAWVYNGNLCCLDWDLVDDSSGHDENVHHIYVYQGYNSGATEGWKLLWETDEHWNTNGHCYEALDDGNITKRNNPSSADAKIDSWTTYSEDFREVKNDYLLIKFIFESGDYAVHYVTAPWKWRYPTNSNIQLSSGFNRSVYKNNSYSAGSGTVIAHVSKWATYNPDISGRVYYNYSLPGNYYSLSSIDTSTTGTKTVTISSNFRCKNGAAVQTTSYNVTVYGMSSYNIPNLSQTEIQYPVPSGTTIYDFIPSQATASYEDGTSQTISIQNSYVSGDTNLSTPGVKNFTITIPSSETKTKEAISRSYSFSVYVSTDVKDAHKWFIGSKEVVAVRADGTQFDPTHANQYFWVKPIKLTVAKNDAYNTCNFSSSPYYNAPSLPYALSDGNHNMHYGDVVTLSRKSNTVVDTNYVPTSDDYIVYEPQVTSTKVTGIEVKNNNSYDVVFHIYGNGVDLSLPCSAGNRVSTHGTLTADTWYSMEFRRLRTWDKVTTTYGGPDGNFVLDLEDMNITGSKNVVTQALSDTITTDDCSYKTAPKHQCPSVRLSLNHWNGSTVYVNMSDTQGRRCLIYDEMSSCSSSCSHYVTTDNSGATIDSWNTGPSRLEVYWEAHIIPDDNTMYPSNEYVAGPWSSIWLN